MLAALDVGSATKLAGAALRVAGKGVVTLAARPRVDKNPRLRDDRNY